MNTLFIAVFAAMAAVAAAGGLGHGAGAIIAGPSGIVTPHGPIGPAGHGLGLGYGLGHGAVIAGPVAHSYAGVGYGVGGLGYGLGLGHGLGYGHGLGLGHGLGYGHGLGLGHGVVTNGGGHIGLSGHGVAVRGPATVPAVVAGPSGKIVAHGLYGVPHGHGW